MLGDERGHFIETWSADRFARAGIRAAFVQDNQSRSMKGVLRGLHYQLPGAQGKLMRVVAGAAWDVVVDLRRASSTFGQWFGIELSAANKRMLWVPEGFAHGFLTLADDTDFIYKCTAPYAPQLEHVLLWNDPAIGIEWPLDADPLLSLKDALGRTLDSVPMFD